MKPTAAAFMLLIAIAVTVLQFEPANQPAGVVLDRISRTGEIVIGYNSDAYPLSFESPAGTAAGYSVDICRRVASSIQSHLNLTFVQTRFVRITAGNRIDAIREGRIDIDCSDAIRGANTAGQVEFSRPTYAAGGGLVSLERSGIKSIRDLQARKVGVIQSDPTGPKLRGQLRHKNIAADVITVLDNLDGMQKLDDGQIDALVSDQLSLIGQIRISERPRDYLLADQEFTRQAYAIVLPTDNPTLLALINRTLSDLNHSGESQVLYDAWIGRTLPAASKPLADAFEKPSSRRN